MGHFFVQTDVKVFEKNMGATYPDLLSTDPKIFTFLKTLKNHSLTLALIGLVVVLVFAAHLFSITPDNGPAKNKIKTF